MLYCRKPFITRFTVPVNSVLYTEIHFKLVCNDVIAVGFYYDAPEITPPVRGVHHFLPDDSPVDSFSPEREVRAIVEGQFLAKYVHALSLGYRITSTSRILATGGGSVNKQILQVSYSVLL